MLAFNQHLKLRRGIVVAVAQLYTSPAALAIEVVIFVWVANDIASKLASSDFVPCSAQIECAFRLNAA